MKTKFILTTAALAMALIAGKASANSSFHNGTSSTVWVAYGIQSWWDTSFPCISSSCGKMIIQYYGWYGIAPGGTTTVDYSAHHHFYHYYYAEDSLGHFWGGNTVLCTPWAAFGQCQGTACTGSYRNLGYREATHGAVCCGELGCWPGPTYYDNWTYNLVL